MPEPLHLAAVDLGASSGRVMRCTLADGKLALHEAHRFENSAVYLPDEGPGRWCWDIVALWRHIQHGLREAARLGPVHAIGIDGWGVDYALLDAQGRLVRPPVAYRDPRTDATFAAVTQRLGREAIYAHTGIQFMAFNSLYQLAADADDPGRPMRHAATLLMLPQLLDYWLTGRIAGEHTLASTSQAYDATRRCWVKELLEPLGVPMSLLPEVVDAGTVLGPLRATVAESLGLSPATSVVAVGSHDTASAVVAAPQVGGDAAYLSSGTWSLLGLELGAPVRSAAALAANFTNEAGVAGTTRFLKNISGLWLLQECRRVWAQAGRQHSFAELAAMAERAEPMAVVIDADDPRFVPPGDMPARLREAAAQSGQALGNDPGAVTRCVLDSLSLAYDRALRAAETLAGRTVRTLHIVGGGGNNTLLNRLTADATGRRVVVGPTEATAIGNALVQAMAMGRVADLTEARRIVADSFALTAYTPDPAAQQRVARGRATLAALSGA